MKGKEKIPPPGFRYPPATPRQIENLARFVNSQRVHKPKKVAR